MGCVMSEIIGRDWYVVATKARCEQVARENLERQGFEVILPQIKISKRQRGIWKAIIEPIFPSYLFVSLMYSYETKCNYLFNNLGGTVGCTRYATF